jgi:hypothetical protein
MSHLPEQPEPPLLELVPGAVLGLLALGQRAAARGVSATAAMAAPLARVVARQALVRDALARLRSQVAGWNQFGSEEMRRWQQAATRLMDQVVPVVARSILERIDLNEVVDQVDLDAVTARIDLNALAKQIDVDQVVERVDLVAIAQRVLDGLDLPAIARGVIDELELSEIIRESTGTVTVEAVDALRLGGMTADRMVSRVIDRLLMRKTEREPAALNEAPDDGQR